jgi:hypothetical protein
VDCIREDKMDGSPFEDLWNYRHVLAHLTVQWYMRRVGEPSGGHRVEREKGLAQTNASWLVIWSGGFPSPPKKCWIMRL